MMLVSLISYVDRNALAQLSPTIMTAAHLDNEHYGWIVSAFSLAYLVGNLLWGRILDRIGPFLGMLAAVALWSLASTAHAFMSGFVGFAMARALLGLGEGATFPGGLRTVAQTLPPDERARGIAVAYSGGSLGAIFTPIIITPIALRFGWRGAFVATGLFGVAWLFVWRAVAVRTPSLRRVPSPDTSGERPRLGDPQLWGFMALYALGAFPLGFVLYAAPLYLHQTMHLTQADLGRWLWLPPLGWEIGYFFWGWRVDRNPSRPIGMRAFLPLVVLGASLALVPSLTSRVFVMALLTFTMFIAAGFIILGLAYATRVFSTGHAALLAGIGAGSWSAVVALAMPRVGRLFDAHREPRAFFLAALLPAIGFVVWAAITQTTRREN
jgi:ACS family hexuronate transporter-like MFS transporter